MIYLFSTFLFALKVSAAALRPDNTYEYIVVGSGPGGGPLAANLARAGHSVLLIEAGDDQGDNTNNTILQNWPLATADPKERWDFFVENTDNAADAAKFKYTTWRTTSGDFYVGLNPPPGAVRLGIYYPRSGTLGGCSQHNAGVVALPNDADWDYIAGLTGDSSWKSSNMRKYFTQLEHNLYLPPGTPGHGFNGWLNVSQIDPAIFAQPGTDGETMAKLGVKTSGGDPNQVLTYLKRDLDALDPNRDTSTGVFGFLQHSDNAGIRSASNSYIRATLAAPQNYPLTVQLDTLVTKVLFSNAPGKKPAAMGVEYLKGKSMYSADPRYNANDKGTVGKALATKEVIIAGGTFNSPQILKLSGIGPAAELRQFGIPVVVDAPGVGSNLGDNQENGLIATAARSFQGFVGIYDVMLKSSVAQRVRDLMMFCGSLSFEGFFPGWPTNYGPGQYDCSIAHMNPRGQDGFVQLRSANPRDTPKINFRFWKTGGDEDQQAILDGIKFTRKLLSQAPAGLAPFTEIHPCPGPISSTGEAPASCTDAKQKEYIRQQVFSHHATSTCAIGKDGDKNAVLDSAFRVRGVDKLRVVDASSFPRVPGAFPIIPTFIISQKASDVILNGGY